MDTSFYLNQIVPLNWWKTELQERSHDHAGPAAIVVVTAMIISYVWNKYMALGFLMMAFLTYPLSHQQIRYFMFLDIYGSAQATACVAIPVLCSKIPFLSAWSMPLHVALAYSILTREWRLCQTSRSMSEEIEKLANLNQTLKEQISTLQQSSRELDEAMTKLLEQMQAAQNLDKEASQTAEKEGQIALQVEVDYAALNEKLEKLTRVCQLATQAEGVDELLNQVDQNQQALTRLTSQCEAKNRELNKLIGEIKGIKDRLAEILSKATSQEAQTGEALQQVNDWISAIIERRV